MIRVLQIISDTNIGGGGRSLLSYLQYYDRSRFHMEVALPRGTNGPRPEITPLNGEDRMLWACNKWLLAHGESAEAAQGAVVALDGENIDIAGDIG